MTFLQHIKRKNISSRAAVRVATANLILCFVLSCFGIFLFHVPPQQFPKLLLTLFVIAFAEDLVIWCWDYRKRIQQRDI